MFLYFATHFRLFFTKKPPMCAPEGPKWGHIGVPKAFLGVSWASFLPLWALLGTPGHPLGAVQEPLGTIFINLGAPRALTGGIFNDFSLNFKLFMYLFQCEINRFPYTHVYQI